MASYINKRTHILTIGILLLLLAGSFVRLYHLDAKSLWSDELYSGSIARYFPLIPTTGSEWYRNVDAHHVSDLDTFWTAKAAELSPPLFELVAKLSVNLFGANDIAMRIPSVLASILLLLWVAFQSWKNRGREEFYVFTWVLVLSALSSTYIQYAQEARPYSLGILFSSILSINFYLRWCFGIDKAEIPKGWEIGVFVLACYTHYYLLCLCGILLVIYFWLAIKRSEWKSFLRLSVVPLACIPWVALNAHTILPGSKGAFAYAPAMGQFEAIDAALHMVYQLAGVALIALMLLVIYLLIARTLFVETINRSFAHIKAAFVLTTVVVLYLLVISQLEMKSGLFHSRHFVFILPLLYLVFSIILSGFVRKPWVAVVIGLVLLATQIVPIREYYKVPKEGYREAAYWLTPKLNQDSIIITSWNTNRYYYKFYIDQSKNKLQQRSISSPAEAPSICNDLKIYKEFGVIAHASHQGMVDALASSCKENFELIETYVPTGMVVQRWKNRSYGS